MPVPLTVAYSEIGEEGMLSWPQIHIDGSQKPGVLWGKRLPMLCSGEDREVQVCLCIAHSFGLIYDVEPKGERVVI